MRCVHAGGITGAYTRQEVRGLELVTAIRKTFICGISSWYANVTAVAVSKKWGNLTNSQI